ncbi:MULTISPECIES: single-stranded DNA-binding protein [Cyanophyceae]|uniref:Single-stranded DNA-binding protein n=1 Tax=Nodularia spumigena CENA596 TaxID=1819295 RepID=A0A166KNH0_NODSP|nr:MULTISPECIES: single-stranded DNA-binding protein [Cyanophyceae]MDB9357880.1 single-stranded DNA-binding protein [Nodularia spumigena CS-587/03]KZL51341.1 single-stranded DNA-binding protein [Nodularia spumigena CENA596]MDB9307056.1 single-stranded DNA-binding protein [Nodularia spumigena CS-591/12]MDB9316783.1 single-stranded DNA-binding protein [Nodularia spumigena CS-590/01A]MDB9322650.1 single-stranded DNA-binding protein [Nodularia spumigena CS-591/07A]
MNSCVLMAEIIQEPQLRYTADNLAITEMLVQFPNSQRTEDQLVTLKVVGWGNMATEIQQNYHIGDRVLLAGRLGMNTVERKEGFKEKRAELTVQQIQSLGSNFSPSPSVTATPTQSPSPAVSPPQNEVLRPVTAPASTPVSVAPQPTNFVPTPPPQNFERTTYPPVQEQEPDPDDIPF